MFATCKAVGGKHFTIAGDDNQLAFAPLSRLDTLLAAHGRWNGLKPF